jgi:hypothetical protein
LHHDYTILTFNALDTIQDILCPGATYRALGLNVTTRPWLIKGWVDDVKKQVQKGSLGSSPFRPVQH